MANDHHSHKACLWTASHCLSTLLPPQRGHLCFHCHLIAVIIVASSQSRSLLSWSPHCSHSHYSRHVAISTTAIIVAHVPLMVGVALYRHLALAECPGGGGVVGVGVGVVHGCVIVMIWGHTRHASVECGSTPAAAASSWAL